MKNVSVLGTAVGEADGHANLSLAVGENLGMFTLGEVEGVDSQSVPVTTIDSLLEQQKIEALDFVKMDIEGSEYKALRGAVRTFEKFRPSLLIELNEVALRRCGSSSKAVTELLHEMGYRGWRIGRNSVEVETLVGDGCEEYIYIHNENRQLMQKFGLPV